MEIKNLMRRNSEYALIESRRELESQRQQFFVSQSEHAQRERIHSCGELEMNDHLHQESYARSCREIEELKRRCYHEENTEKQRRLSEIPTQHDQESRTVSLFFYDPDLLSSYDIPAFLIKLLLPRGQESLAAKLECRETHERM